MIPNRLQNKTAIVTGASSGIGQGIAKFLAKAGCNVIATGRNVEALDALSLEHRSIESHFFDVSSREECVAFHKKMEGRVIDILVNNAGLALGNQSVDNLLWEDIETIIDTNVKGLLYMTKLFAGDFKRRNSGHILNTGSIAGHEAYPGGSLYNASKFAVNAITKAVKLDLTGTKVKVSQISPGMVNTNFSKTRFYGDQEKADKVYEGVKPLSADDVAEIAYFMLNAPEHVNMLDTIIFPVAQSAATVVSRTLDL